MRFNRKWLVSLFTAGALLVTAVPAFAAEPSDAVSQDGTAAITTENPFEEDGSYTKLEPESGTDLDGLVHGASSSGELTSVTLQGIEYQQTEARKMLSLINEFRTSGSAWYWDASSTQKIAVTTGSVVYDCGLEEIAMQRAAEIAASFSHTRPDGTYCFTAQASDGSTAAAENIGCGTGLSTASAAFEGFKEENENYSGQGHRRTMLESSYTAVGCACVKVNGIYFWVQEFGSKTSVGQTSALDGTKNVTINISASRIADVTDESGNTEKAISVYIPSTYSVYSGQSRAVPVAVVIVLLQDAVPEAEALAPYIIIYNNNATWTIQDTSIASISGTTIYGQKEGQTEMDVVETVAGIDYPGTTTLLVTSAAPIQMHRMYNPNSGEHFYTGSTEERDTLIKAGWKYEGVGWNAPTGSDTPVYRLYNPNAGDHHYTTSTDEADMLIAAGWKYEGIGWYSDYNETTPLYRQYNPNAKTGTHNYTTSTTERDHLVSLGWRDESIGWYGL